MMLPEHREPLGTKRCEHCVGVGRQTTLDEVKKVVNTVQADWFRYHIGGEPVASERLARQNGALSALQAILQALDTLSTKEE